jgi:hypothetical protein
VEETRVEADMTLDKPSRKCAALAVIENPLVGEFSENLSVLYDYGERLGGLLVEMALRALNVSLGDAKEKIESYGKGAVVGAEGELEQAHAILHPKFGAPVRKALGGIEYCKAIIPSTCKIGVLGTGIDVPLFYKRAIWVVSNFDTMTVVQPDAPKPNEIVIALVLTDSGRPLARTAGLRKAEVQGLDGLR